MPDDKRAVTGHARVRRDLVSAAACLAGLLVWDASGADLSVERLFADGRGFGARDDWWASALLHSGGRWAAWIAAAVLLMVALRTPASVSGGPDRAERVRWLGVMLLCALAVPALKRLSLTSCPWDLVEFGGIARHVSHWRLGVTDGGPGHCFPAGHAVAAFAFLGLHFQWRDHHPGRARLRLVGVLAAGALFGLAQVVRGAHYVSHILWSGWLCWCVCVVASAAFSRMPSRVVRLAAT